MYHILIAEQSLPYVWMYADNDAHALRAPVQPAAYILRCARDPVQNDRRVRPKMPYPCQ